MSRLGANIYVAPPLPVRRPTGQVGTWSPISSTLIHGEHEAVLVDTPITIEQNEALADWVEKQLAPQVAGHPSKKLTALYITHGHLDHWAGINLLQKRFPGLQAVATKGTIQHMQDQVDRNGFYKFWQAYKFEGRIDEDFVFAQELPSDGKFTLEGNELQAIEVGHSDTYDSTILWVPSIKLAVCGDVVYGDCHQMLAFANTKALREEWLRAVEIVEALKPEIVVAGHKKDGELDGAFHLENTKEYIRQFGELVENGGAKNAKELLKLMLDKYPNRFNSGAIMSGCLAQFPQDNKL